MKADVNREECISCGLCNAISPEVFGMDDEGISVVIADPVPAENESVLIVK